MKSATSGALLVRITIAAMCAVLCGCSKRPLMTERIGSSVQGRPIEAITLGDGPERIWILATIHGNEWAGTPLVHELISFLGRRPEFLKGKTLVISPVVNPDGFELKQRRNVNGVDLNRNFPAQNRENTDRYGIAELSEPESQAMYAFLHKFKPARIVSIHQPFSIVDWDGPGQPLAEHMAQHTVLPFARVGSKPGSLGSHAGEDLRIPIITYELPRGAEKDTTATIWGRYGRALLAAIVYPNHVAKWDFHMPYPLGVSCALLAAVVAAAASLIWFAVKRSSPRIAKNLSDQSDVSDLSDLPDSSDMSDSSKSSSSS